MSIILLPFVFFKLSCLLSLDSYIFGDKVYDACVYIVNCVCVTMHLIHLNNQHYQNIITWNGIAQLP